MILELRFKTCFSLRLKLFYLVGPIVTIFAIAPTLLPYITVINGSFQILNPYRYNIGFTRNCEV